MMAAQGLAKLVEECGEVLQVAGKLLAYPEGAHPDGGEDLRLRLQKELADMTAAAIFVVDKLGLDQAAMGQRSTDKLMMYYTWDAGDK